MPTRCHHCSSVDKECKVDLRTGRCSECARLGQSCNQQVTRIEYEKIRATRLKIARQLEEAEEEEDAMTRKLLEHRARVRRLRKQLRMKEEKEAVAQDREAASIAEAERAERELQDLFAKPIPLDLPFCEPVSFDGRLWKSPSEWSALDGVPFSVLGGTPVSESGS